MAENPKQDGKEVVAYLGPEASYTHQAATLAFPPHEGHTHTPIPTIPALFTTLFTTPSTPTTTPPPTTSVIPFENSSNGPVLPTLDSLTRHATTHRVVAEIYLPITHCLLVSLQPPNPASNTLPHISRLHTHPQAHAQCSRFLATALPHAEYHETASTSRAAALVAEAGRKGDGSTAAVASRMAAEVYGLRVLEEGVEDAKGGNWTRFFVVRRVGEGEAGGVGADGEGKGAEEGWKTLVAFTVPHSEPGALAESLAVFGRAGLNLTSLHTRPSGGRAWEYVFFAEVRGRRGGEGRGGRVDEALEGLGKVARWWAWLGSWRDGAAQAREGA